MTNPNNAQGQGQRRGLPPAMQAALWTVSNGQCYAPGCTMPVVLEVRPGVYKKNAQVAHIYGVRPGAERYKPGMSAEERDSFANLLLLCLAHHEEVDGKGGADRYPPETLLKWKQKHEGEYGSVLSGLPVPDTDMLLKELTKIAEPPLNRLEAITERLEETGVATADTVAELKQIIETMSLSGIGVSRRTADALVYAADVLNTGKLNETARMLADAADHLDARKLNDAARALMTAAEMQPARRGY
jgi:hypothetical protein